jgi:hypothetical protein
MIKAERTTKKHPVEMLTKIESAMIIEAVKAINTNTADRAFDLLLDKDITRLQAEEIGQRLRTPAWIDSLICTTSTSCLNDSQQAAIFIDGPNLKAKACPMLLRDRIIGIEFFRPNTWVNPYLSLTGGSPPSSLKNKIKSFMNSQNPKWLVQLDRHY